MNEQFLQPSFTLGEIKDRAIALTKKHWATYLYIVLAGIAVILPLEMLSAAWGEMYGGGIVSFLFIVGSLVAQMIFAVGLTRYALVTSEDGKIPFVKYFACNAKMIVALVLASLLFALAVFCGLIAFVVPGIILMIGLSFNGFAVVEKNTGAIEALKTSWRITKGNRMNIAIFWILLSVVNMVVVVVPMLVAMLPLLLDMGGAAIIAGILGFIGVIWALIASIAMGVFATIASALMYRKMEATRK